MHTQRENKLSQKNSINWKCLKIDLQRNKSMNEYQAMLTEQMFKG